jgi:hypothetical protein
LDKSGDLFLGETSSESILAIYRLRGTETSMYWQVLVNIMEQNRGRRGHEYPHSSKFIHHPKYVAQLVAHQAAIPAVRV